MDPPRVDPPSVDPPSGKEYHTRHGDVTALEQSLSQCEAARETSASSATFTQSKCPPIFRAIESAGVEEFKSTTETLHRVGMNR